MFNNLLTIAFVLGLFIAPFVVFKLVRKVSLFRFLRKIPKDQRVVYRTYTAMADKSGQCRAASTRICAVTDQTVFLGRKQLELGSICEVQRVDSVLRVLLSNDEVWTLWPGRHKARKLERAINSVLSVYRFTRQIEKYKSDGRAFEIRSFDCTHCGLLNDVTEFALGSQLYCNYCKQISNVDETPAKNRKLRQGFCELCGYYSNIGTYTTALLIFILIAVVGKTKSFNCCNHCARRQARNSIWLSLLLGTVIARLGILVNGYTWLRAMVNSRHNGADANARRLAHDRQYSESLNAYQSVLSQASDKPAGWLYNTGVLHAKLGQISDATRAFQSALKACPNCLPIREALVNLQNSRVPLSSNKVERIDLVVGQDLQTPEIRRSTIVS